MARIYLIENEYIDEKSLNNAIQDILNVMRKEKRTYSMNIFLLKETINYLEKEVKELSNSKIFQ